MIFQRSLTLLPVAFILASCASVQIQDEFGTSAEVKPDSYARYKDRLGVVLLDARWGRQWKCGKYENAQLVSFSFDKLPLSPNKPDEAPSDLTIGTTSHLAASQKFESYALLIPPGEYALSNFKIKLARSVSSIDYWVANRSHLIKDGKPLGGKFVVAPGEVVYVGNFALDCYENPTLWRYYANGRDGFRQQLSDYQSKYPFLDLANVKFRLFETTTIGRSYALP
ncbi:hypothetical protein [Xenophilus azovorans]|uniref:hypothetical protein n=1 Tax=Xenophilus azovorans TaxID=151755 RepID=UPI0012EDDD2D|nr:hypothetical protein [Xenophilus azovorans]